MLPKECFNLDAMATTLKLTFLDEFDWDTRRTTEYILGGDLSEEGWTQATLGVDCQGLGLRQAQIIALPCFIASRISALPLARELFRQMDEAGLAPIQSLTEGFQQRTEAAIAKWKQPYVGDTVEEIDTCINNAKSEAARRWSEWKAGDDAMDQDKEDDEEVWRAAISKRPGANIVREIWVGRSGTPS